VQAIVRRSNQTMQYFCIRLLQKCVIDFVGKQSAKQGVRAQSHSEVVSEVALSSHSIATTVVIVPLQFCSDQSERFSTCIA